MRGARTSRETRILGGPRTLRAVDVSRRAGTSLRAAIRLWRALGFPGPPGDVYAYTEHDQRALARLTGLVSNHVMTSAQALEMTRAIGRSVDRMAAWQVQILHDVVRSRPPRPGVPSGPNREAAELAELVTALVDDLEPLVVHAWRRHLLSALADQVADLVPPDGVRRGVRTVGFVDMVGFTEAVHALDRHEVAELVQRFEDRVADRLASRDVRLVKTIGDEVMFVTPEVDQAALLALDLVADLSGDGLPPVRVGLATGAVVDRLGDVFGTTVNRASRLTETAEPSTVVVDRATAEAVTVPMRVETLPPQPLKGIGRTLRFRVER